MANSEYSNRIACKISMFSHSFQGNLSVEGHTKKEDEKANWTLKEILTHPNVLLSVMLIAFFGMLCTMNNPILEPELRAKV